jgi:hypothetical protein
MPKTKKKKAEVVAKKKETLESIQYSPRTAGPAALGWDIGYPMVKAAVVRLAWNDPSDPSNEISRAHAAGFLLSTWAINKPDKLHCLSDILPLWWVSLVQVVDVRKAAGCETRDESFRKLMEEAAVEFGDLMYNDVKEFVQEMKTIGLPCPDLVPESKNP